MRMRSCYCGVLCDHRSVHSEEIACDNYTKLSIHSMGIATFTGTRKIS